MSFAAPTTESDPSSYYAILGTAAAAVLALLVSFGVPLTDAQQSAILGVVAVIGPLLTALGIRRHAWAPSSVDEIRAEERARFSTPPPPEVPYYADGDGEVPA